MDEVAKRSPSQLFLKKNTLIGNTTGKDGDDTRRSLESSNVDSSLKRKASETSLVSTMSCSSIDRVPPNKSLSSSSTFNSSRSFFNGKKRKNSISSDTSNLNEVWTYQSDQAKQEETRNAFISLLVSNKHQIRCGNTSKDQQMNKVIKSFDQL
mmetsp:Transcript_18361/g.21183  ORF Transcript_18361/g.21183 Transcript_18361/m.21183 type:complete len:153 (+) Transcript_18361:122-580(+)